MPCCSTPASSVNQLASSSERAVCSRFPDEMELRLIRRTPGRAGHVNDVRVIAYKATREAFDIRSRATRI